ncbi:MULTISPECIES: hypothetical protein [Bacillus]|jgi:membrane-bound ClpP family serine protease|uniref:hypothetical protein n=1 Tax=Bacillus TaxID=1386 RepID=UPI00081FAD8F|nr:MULTISPECIES: hypothetical protein [Bacillus]AOC55688.1 hypothetical protein BEN31_02260 [Bacillus pumilus]MBR0587414.1 hypothetical protein [Bacillus pumilus DW2J2]MBR0618853.1 hypothetical protein [Bacillus pumilus]MBR0625159.1 hypothetical protein [Bacillus pumilus]MCY7725324.1 hypothetical protein [Bacillus pumilus]
MDVFGLPLETLYLYILMISGILTLVFVFFGDVFDGLFEAIPVSFLQPTLILAFLTFFSAGGFISEKTAIVGSGLGAVLSAILAVVLVTCLNVFVLVPLSSAEESLSYTEADLKGRTGEIIVSVPKDGFGEVLLISNSGKISKPAVSFVEEEIPYGTRVLVVEVNKGVLSVIPNEEI